MYKLNSLPETISLFPLGNALLLPHSRLPLNIFEPRYLSLLDDTFEIRSQTDWYGAAIITKSKKW